MVDTANEQFRYEFDPKSFAFYFQWAINDIHKNMIHASKNGLDGINWCATYSLNGTEIPLSSPFRTLVAEHLKDSFPGFQIDVLNADRKAVQVTWSEKWITC